MWKWALVCLCACQDEVVDLVPQGTVTSAPPPPESGPCAPWAESDLPGLRLHLADSARCSFTIAEAGPVFHLEARLAITLTLPDPYDVAGKPLDGAAWTRTYGTTAGSGYVGVAGQAIAAGPDGTIAVSGIVATNSGLPNLWLGV